MFLDGMNSKGRFAVRSPQSYADRVLQDGRLLELAARLGAAVKCATGLSGYGKFVEKCLRSFASKKKKQAEKQPPSFLSKDEVRRKHVGRPENGPGKSEVTTVVFPGSWSLDSDRTTVPGESPCWKAEGDPSGLARGHVSSALHPAFLRAARASGTVSQLMRVTSVLGKPASNGFSEAAVPSAYWQSTSTGQLGHKADNAQRSPREASTASVVLYVPENSGHKDLVPSFVQNDTTRLSGEELKKQKAKQRLIAIGIGAAVILFVIATVNSGPAAAIAVAVISGIIALIFVALPLIKDIMSGVSGRRKGSGTVQEDDTGGGAGDDGDGADGGGDTGDGDTGEDE